MTLVVISILNLCSAANRFVCVVFMRLIATLHMTSFLMIFRRRWIPRFSPSFAATSTRSLIGQLTVLVRTHLTCPMRVFPLSRIFLMPAVQLTFGDISILLLLPFFGPGGMAPVPPVLISVVFRMCGFLLFSHVISFPVLSLTIVVSSLLSRSRTLSHLAPVCGSSIFLSCRSRHMSV